MDQLSIGHDTLVPARDLMERLEYVEVRRSSNANVVQFTVTYEGRWRLA